MEISTEKLKAAYEAASGEGKAMIRSMFPDFKPSPIETIKTFADACEALEEGHNLVKEYYVCINELGVDRISPDLVAYLKLRVIVAALNEGWKPQFTEGEYRWYPWFWLYNTKADYEAESERWKENHPLVLFGGGAGLGVSAGFVCAYSNIAPSPSDAHFGSRLCLKSKELANYCGRQFADLWVDFYLIRK